MLLTVLADDFTGALDTGIQFAAKGIATYVAFGNLENAWQQNCEVLVIDLQSRHLSSEEAFRAAFSAARCAKEAGAQYLYKKTDSTLRGNIGAELEGALRGFGEEKLCFVPAYPKLDRITRGMVQFVEGQPLCQTAYARDALNPVRFSRVDKILQEQSSLPVFSEDGNWGHGIFVADAETDEDLKTLAERVKGKFRVFAGCAGFAEFLDRALPLKRGELPCPEKRDRLLLVSGSIHPHSLEQLQEAQRQGRKVVALTPEIKLSLCLEGSGIPASVEARMTEILKEEGTAVLASVLSREEVEKFDRMAESSGIPAQKAAEYLSHALGDFCGRMTCRIPKTAIAVFGGDTAAQVLRACGAEGIRPVARICEGVPGCLFQSLDGVEHLLVTKAGGFGELGMIRKIEESVKIAPDPKRKEKKE